MLGQENRVVGRRHCVEPRDRERWSERQPGAGGGARLLQPSELRKARSKKEMREMAVAVDVNGASKPGGRLVVGIGAQLAIPGDRHPKIRLRIARTQPQRFLNMGLRFFAATVEEFGKANECVRRRHISVESQRLLELANALSHPIGVCLDHSQSHARPGVVRDPVQHGV